jgi:hypothetical protein
MITACGEQGLPIFAKLNPVSKPKPHHQHNGAVRLVANLLNGALHPFGWSFHLPQFGQAPKAPTLITPDKTLPVIGNGQTIAKAPLPRARDAAQPSESSTASAEPSNGNMGQSALKTAWDNHAQALTAWKASGDEQDRKCAQKTFRAVKQSVAEALLCDGSSAAPSTENIARLVASMDIYRESYKTRAREKLNRSLVDTGNEIALRFVAENAHGRLRDQAIETLLANQSLNIQLAA